MAQDHGRIVDNADRVQAWHRLRALSAAPFLTAEESREVAKLAHVLRVRVQMKRVDLRECTVNYFEVGGGAA